MGSTAHQRRASGRAMVISSIAAAAAAVVAGAALALTDTAQASSLAATYTRTSAWADGYTGQYVVTNATVATRTDWTLEFDLPEGTTIGTLWNGEHTVEGRRVTVKPADTDRPLAPGASVTVGFVATAGGTATPADPTSCVINETRCTMDRTPTAQPPAGPAEQPAAKDPAPAAPSTPAAPRTSTPTGSGTTPPARNPGAAPESGTGRFSPFVDASLLPSQDLLDTADRTGVKDFNLAFIRSDGGCNPLWGGRVGLADNRVARQIGALRARGGDVRVSFGGAAGKELAVTCFSVDELVRAYGKVIDAYKLTRIDFDVEGKSLSKDAANNRRSRALARLQKSHPGLEISFTVPVNPEGLNRPAMDLVADARKTGVDISAINIMAMDYGSHHGGDMGQYAIKAATTTHAQLKELLGLSDEKTWSKIAVTPMIGINDVVTEIFTVEDAKELAAFARAKNLAWLSMWSLARDRQCPGGERRSADATCSSIFQEPLAFTRALAAYH
ncbi:cellulose binding domain-containing protein [Streptomyces sp. NPDC051018]|uniref:glycoside hydrolase family 18 protein n=1 Tax=Streptomyces sp. NPDC051018 TaxID=3365639 RepID=UPI0037BD4B81